MLLGFGTVAMAQETSPGYVEPASAQAVTPYVPGPDVYVPASSVARPEDAGLRAHTNYLLYSPNGGKPQPMAKPVQLGGVQPNVTYQQMLETPASMTCVYKTGPTYTGCLPTYPYHTTYASGGWGAIAVVDAYDNPDIAYSLSVFNAQWGLPASTFVKVYANGNNACTTPPFNAGWALEEALDVEWAHAMAPLATIILVEACDNSYTNLLYAEQVAGAWVKSYGGGDISNSWSGAESASQQGASGYDNYFYRYYYDHITYFASSGDYGYGMCGSSCNGVSYPSSNPWVISAGGTTINRLSNNLASNGNFSNESCWAGSGGGISAYETWLSPPAIYNGMGPWTNYQYAAFGQAARKIPDMSFNADPKSGVYVYDYDNGGWYGVGGTSVSSPALAGIVNLAKQKLGQTPPGGGYYNTEELNLIYSQLFTFTAYPINFYDVKTGSNGVAAHAGWDYCTGVGSPRGKLGK